MCVFVVVCVCVRAHVLFVCVSVRTCVVCVCVVWGECVVRGVEVCASSEVCGR